ncbi:hypothetical protein B0J13DRAFT_524265 [Dactylonectria estremocensis]|uniref:Uncharacterized protein n=1 Tax=Dactylonectria estremocensis TaxID=1079267 RepID=A0A9P9F035_9HYPO|nr:hypothetical protein B0J13DRAFT_524265 [Dactylonectria estremocensis]
MNLLQADGSWMVLHQGRHKGAQTPPLESLQHPQACAGICGPRDAWASRAREASNGRSMIPNRLVNERMSLPSCSRWFGTNLGKDGYGLLSRIAGLRKATTSWVPQVTVTVTVAMTTFSKPSPHGLEALDVPVGNSGSVRAWDGLARNVKWFTITESPAWNTGAALPRVRSRCSGHGWTRCSSIHHGPPGIGWCFKGHWGHWAMGLVLGQQHPLWMNPGGATLADAGCWTRVTTELVTGDDTSTGEKGD